MAKKGNGVVKAENGTKAKANFKKVAAEKAKAHQTKRLEFIAKFGKAIAAQWAKLGDKATVMAVAKAVNQPVRLVDYVTVALGLRKSEDKGLLAWRDADGMVTSAACPAPKKSKKANHEAQPSA